MAVIAVVVVEGTKNKRKATQDGRLRCPPCLSVSCSFVFSLSLFDVVVVGVGVAVGS